MLYGLSINDFQLHSSRPNQTKVSVQYRQKERFQKILRFLKNLMFLFIQKFNDGKLIEFLAKKILYGRNDIKYYEKLRSLCCGI